MGQLCSKCCKIPRRDATASRQDTTSTPLLEVPVEVHGSRELASVPTDTHVQESVEAASVHTGTEVASVHTGTHVLQSEEAEKPSTSGHAGSEEDVFALVRKLDIAVEAGDIDEATRLQKAVRSSGHSLVTDWRCTPLHLAAMYGSTAAVSWLAAREGVKERDARDGDTALHIAAERGHTQCVEMLINTGADVNVRNKYGDTPLKRALENKHEKVIQVLIERGADVTLLGKQGADSEFIRKYEKIKKDLDPLSGKIKSTSEFIKAPTAKLIIVGKFGAGKTSMVTSMSKRGPADLIDEGPLGRTEGIEVSIQKINFENDKLVLYAYDFGGQSCYYPIHQIYLSPHSLFAIVADLDNLEQDKIDTEHFLNIIKQRVDRPVCMLVGTKIDKCPNEVNEKKQEFLKLFDKMEKRDMSSLRERQRKLKFALEKSKQNDSASEYLDYEFKDLSSEEIMQKLEIVERCIDKRPVLSNNVMAINSLKYEGIEEILDEISNIISENAQNFVIYSIPVTWLDIETTLKDCKERACLEWPEFIELCQKHNVMDEEEIKTMLNYLSNSGSLIYHEDQGSEKRKLRNAVYVDPSYITNILNIILNHHNYNPEFWMKMVSEKGMPKNECEESKLQFQNGIISDSLIRYMVSGTKMDGKGSHISNLMNEFDICFQLKKGFTNVDFRQNVNYYLLPSLLTSEDPARLSDIWPVKSSALECILQFYLSTPTEPYGLFEKISVQLNYYLSDRRDVKKCTVGSIHDYDDRLKMQMISNEDCESHSILFSIRTHRNRLGKTRETLLIIVAKTLELMKYYPTVMLDWYIVCPLCKVSTPNSRWPAENTLFQTATETPPVKCYLCNEKMDTVGGLPVIIDMPPKFSSLFGNVVRKIGGDWCRLLRRLCKSLDDADKIIEDTRHAASSLTDSAAGALYAWRKKFGTEASFNELVVALERIQRRDLTDEADQYEALRAVDSGKQTTDGFSELILTTSEFIGGEWRHLGRDLYASLDEVDRIIDQISATSTYRYDQPECAYIMLRAWQKQGGTYDCLIEKLSVDHKDILSKAGIDHEERRASAESGKKTSDAFATLILTASKFVGSEWRHLGRDLYSSLDEVDRKIDEIFASYYKDQRECAYQMLRAWQKQGGTYDGLIEKLSVDHKDILSKAGIEFKSTATHTESEDLQGGDTDEKSRRRGALKMVLLKTSKSIPSREWRNLGRHLEKPVSDNELINIEEATSDLRERVHQVLVKWRRENADSATYAVLRKTLIKLKLQDVADEVKDICDKFQIDENEALKE